MFFKKNKVNITTVGKGSVFEGKLLAKSKMKIEGEFKGKLEVKDNLYLQKWSHVNGEIKVRNAVINGKLEGTINATNLKLLSKGVINGNIYTGSFYVRHGAKTNGSIYITGRDT